MNWIPVERPVTLWGAGGKSYGGLTVRFKPESRNTTVITVPTGRTEADLSDTPLVWADYTTRLSLMLTGGRHVCPVALLYVGQSTHEGKVITPEDMTSALQDALFDCDWVPYDAFENHAKISGRQVQLQQRVPRPEQRQERAIQTGAALPDKWPTTMFSG